MGSTINAPVTRGVAKVPVVMQMEALECGAASLAMIMAYYGTWYPLEKVRVDCGVSRDGSSARNILKAARSYGMTADGYHYELDAFKENQETYLFSSLSNMPIKTFCSWLDDLSLSLAERVFLLG